MSEEVRSPRPNSDQFDALIELLATDDAGDDSHFHILPEGTVSEGLRDAEGKLDYAKIRSLFLQRRANDNNGNHVPTSDQPRSEPSPVIKLPQVSMNLTSAEYVVYVAGFRLWWKNRQLWQKALFSLRLSLYHGNGMTSPVKPNQYQRFYHSICRGTAKGLIKAVQGWRHSVFPICPSPRGLSSTPLSMCFSVLTFDEHRFPETR